MGPLPQTSCAPNQKHPQAAESGGAGAGAWASIPKVPSPVFQLLRKSTSHRAPPYLPCKPQTGEEIKKWEEDGGLPVTSFPVILTRQQPCPCSGSLSGDCLHLSFPGPPRELGKATRQVLSRCFPFELSGSSPELPLLCMADRLVPLDVR